MTLFAVAALVQSVAAFNPPLDLPIAYTVSESREDASGAQRFAVDRRVTFRRNDGGFAAEVETLRARSASAARPATMLERATAGMIGRRVVLSLDSNGAIIAVDDLAGVWAAQVDGLAATLTGSQGGQRAIDVAALIAPLRAMTVDQQRARIGDMLTPLIGTAFVMRGIRPPHPVSVPARGADGMQAMLAGTEATTLVAGMLTYERSAGDGDRRAQVVRRIDPATGLVRETVETTQTGLADARLTVTRSIVISP